MEFETDSCHRDIGDTVVLVQHDVPRGSCDWIGKKNVFHNTDTQTAFHLRISIKCETCSTHVNMLQGIFVSTKLFDFLKNILTCVNSNVLQ